MCAKTRRTVQINKQMKEAWQTHVCAFYLQKSILKFHKLPSLLLCKYGIFSAVIHCRATLTCWESRLVLRKNPRRQPMVTDNTERMSKPFLLQTSLIRARIASKATAMLSSVLFGEESASHGERIHSLLVFGWTDLALYRSDQSTSSSA